MREENTCSLVKTDLQIFLVRMFEDDGMCCGDETFLFQTLLTPTKSFHPLYGLSRSLHDALCEEILFNHCPERTLVISADPAPPHLPWQFLGDCLSHYFISNIFSSHVRWVHGNIRTAVNLTFVMMLHWASWDYFVNASEERDWQVKEKIIWGHKVR